MLISDHQLIQIDEPFLRNLLVHHDIEAVLRLCITLTSDLKEARERLNQNPTKTKKGQPMF